LSNVSKPLNLASSFDQGTCQSHLLRATRYARLIHLAAGLSKKPHPRPASYRTMTFSTPEPIPAEKSESHSHLPNVVHKCWCECLVKPIPLYRIEYSARDTPCSMLPRTNTCAPHTFAPMLRPHHAKTPSNAHHAKQSKQWYPYLQSSPLPPFFPITLTKPPDSSPQTQNSAPLPQTAPSTVYSAPTYHKTSPPSLCGSPGCGRDK
jgi:hypothetical protein